MQWGSKEQEFRHHACSIIAQMYEDSVLKPLRKMVLETLPEYSSQMGHRQELLNDFDSYRRRVSSASQDKKPKLEMKLAAAEKAYTEVNEQTKNQLQHITQEQVST